MGIKNDPVVQHELRVWVRKNLFFADKRDVEEVVLPKPRREPVSLTMEPQVEGTYRETAQNIEHVLRGLVSKYRDRSPDADDPELESARIKLAREFKILTELSNMPGKVVPGAKNPKIDRAVQIMDESLGRGGRYLLFTDSPEFAGFTAQSLSERNPGTLHAVAFADKIEIWQNGTKIKKYGPRKYKDNTGRVWDKKQWKVFILQRVIQPNPSIVSLTLTKSYAVGQNLQSFDTVIHLDRDTWNAETMKQRMDRCWRSGQKRTVEEYTLDMVYENPVDEMDETLDQIRGHMQELESDLFDTIVIQSQTEAMGREWFDMKQMNSSFKALNRRLFELTLSPLVTRKGKERDPMHS